MAEKTEYELLMIDERSLLTGIAELEAILHDAHVDLAMVREQLVVYTPT